MWENNNYDMAVQSYFRTKSFTTRAMHEGKEWHKKWEAEVKKTNCMPKIFGAKKLKNPETELRIERQLDEWLNLRGVIDLYDNKTIIDFKSGATPAERYAGTWQPKVYQILVPNATRAEIHRYSPVTKDVDMSIVHLTDKTLEDAVNWVVTNASEMQHYLTENKLHERFQ